MEESEKEKGRCNKQADKHTNGTGTLSKSAMQLMQGLTLRLGER